jgi:hypothetical protein
MMLILVFISKIIAFTKFEVNLTAQLDDIFNMTFQIVDICNSNMFDPDIFTGMLVLVSRFRFDS